VVVPAPLLTSNSEQSPQSVEPLIYDLVSLSFAVAERTHALVGDVMTDLKLTPSLANALWHLDPRQGSPSMRQLADRLAVDPSTITFIADRLEDRGLLTREVDASNRRVKTLVLTEAGMQTRRDLVDAMATRSPIAHLDPTEQHQLHNLLAKALGVEARSPDLRQC
jgi:DNA-binding MarR family transcriptional regulator